MCVVDVPSFLCVVCCVCFGFVYVDVFVCCLYCFADVPFAVVDVLLFSFSLV